MKRVQNQVILLATMITAIVLFSQMTFVTATSNFRWGIKEGKYHYHVKKFSSIYDPATGITQREGEYDAYIEVSNIPEIPEDPSHWGHVTFTGNALDMYFANGSEGAYFEFRAVAIGNWTELTRFYNESFQLSHMLGVNSTFINTASVWGYILHWDYIPGETYAHYEYQFSKTDGVLNYYLEDAVLPLGYAYNTTREYSRIQNNLIIILGVSVMVAVAVIGLIIRRKK